MARPQVKSPLRAQADQLEAPAISQELVSQNFKVAEEVAEGVPGTDEASRLASFPANGVTDEGEEEGEDVVLLDDDVRRLHSSCFSST